MVNDQGRPGSVIIWTEAHREERDYSFRSDPKTKEGENLKRE